MIRFHLVNIVLALCVASYYINAKRHLTHLQNKWNITSGLNQSFMIFQQVPKTGSEQMNAMIEVLALKHNFTSFSANPSFTQQFGQFHTFDFQTRGFYVNMLQFEPVQPKNKSIVYKKYMNFLNFEEFNKTNPIYISMVRDPLERVISWYYYHRQTTYLLEFEEHFTPKYYKESYEDCVAAQREPCQFIDNTPIVSEMETQKSQISYYCGHEPECQLFGNEKAFQMAVANVEQYYSVVGILELMPETLTVLESFVPFYYNGVTQVYEDQFKKTRRNQNLSKPRVREDIKDMVSKNISLEIKFYEFCKQRLYKQLLLVI